MDELQSLSHTNGTANIRSCSSRSADATLYGELRRHRARCSGPATQRLPRRRDTEPDTSTADLDSTNTRCRRGWLHQRQERDPPRRVYVERKRNFVGQHFWARFSVSTVGRDERRFALHSQPGEGGSASTTAASRCPRWPAAYTLWAASATDPSSHVLISSCALVTHAAGSQVSAVPASSRSTGHLIERVDASPFRNGRASALNDAQLPIWGARAHSQGVSGHDASLPNA